MKPSEVLRAARATIEKPENWTQGVYARDSFRNPVEPWSQSACAWSVGGALFAAKSRGGEWRRAAKALSDQLPSGVAHVDDIRTHAEVLALFDRAIAAAEARGE